MPDMPSFIFFPGIHSLIKKLYCHYNHACEILSEGFGKSNQRVENSEMSLSVFDSKC